MRDPYYNYGRRKATFPETVALLITAAAWLAAIYIFIRY